VAQEAHYGLICEDIRRFLERPHQSITTPTAPSAPPGSPIGDPGMHWVNWDWSGSSNLWGNYDGWWWE